MASSYASDRKLPARSFGARFLARRTEGAVAGALVFIVCFLAWSLGSSAFEAQAVLELPPTGSARARGFDPYGQGLAFDMIRIAAQGDFVFGYAVFSDDVYGVVSADVHRMRVVCRASSQATAVAKCTQALAAVHDLRKEVLVVSPVAPVAKPRSPVHWPGVLLAVLFATACGLAYMLFRTLFGVAPRPSPKREHVSQRVPAPSAPSAPSAPAAPPEVPMAVLSGHGSEPPRFAHTRRPPMRASPRPAMPDAESLRARSVPPSVVVDGVIDAPSDVPEPIRAVVRKSSPASSASSPSADSMPTPHIPEGPLVEAVPVRNFVPHPRLVRLPSDERFQALCSRIAWNADDAPNVVGVTSLTDVGPKVPMVAARIAWFVAQLNKVRVLLVEAEFEAPQLHAVLGVDAPRQGGFSQQLQARFGPARTDPFRVLRLTPTLDVLVESRFPAHRATHVPQFEFAVEIFRLHYDVLIASMPPIEMLSERNSFPHLADNIITVIPRGTRPQVARAAAERAFGRDRVLAMIEETEQGERTTFSPRDS